MGLLDASFYPTGLPCRNGQAWLHICTLKPLRASVHLCENIAFLPHKYNHWKPVRYRKRKQERTVCLLTIWAVSLKQYMFGDTHFHSVALRFHNWILSISNCSKSGMDDAEFSRLHSNVKRGDIVGISGFPGLVVATQLLHFFCQLLFTFDAWDATVDVAKSKIFCSLSVTVTSSCPLTGRNF